jgi:hypothetical protein
MASQAADSLGLRNYPRIALDRESPNHSTFSGTRLAMDVETHRKALRGIIGRGIGSRSVLERLSEWNATPLEASVALRSIAFLDNEAGCGEFSHRLGRPQSGSMRQAGRPRPLSGQNERRRRPIGSG